MVESCLVCLKVAMTQASILKYTSLIRIHSSIHQWNIMEPSKKPHEIPPFDRLSKAQGTVGQERRTRQGPRDVGTVPVRVGPDSPVTTEKQKQYRSHRLSVSEFWRVGKGPAFGGFDLAVRCW